MNRIAQYYQQKFYPDLDISVVEEKLAQPEILEKAIVQLQQTHYPDMDTEQIRQQIKPQQPKPKPSPPTTDMQAPKYVYDIDVFDNRPNGTKINAKTNANIIKDIVKEAKLAGIDPYTALAMSMQETGLGNGWVDNPFHLSTPKTENTVRESMQFLKDKFIYAKRLGKKTEPEILQAWNGYGKITPKSEYGGNWYYGVDVSKNPIDMNKTPVYGNRIIDLRENVIKKNPQIIKMVQEFGNTNIK